MKIFILTRLDSWERVEILGAFVDIDKAKDFAAKEEPDKEYSWLELSDNAHIVYPHLFTGPVYQYNIEELEVIE